MFKSLDNNSSIPNNYVYTSHKGTEYMYLEGAWLNCETMSTVDSTHTFKMNQSAIKQIAEHNSKNEIQIGKKYIINESEYVYVGRNNFTLNGNMLTENINTRVMHLVEADNTEESSTEVPNGYVYTSGKNKSYYKKNGQWFSVDTKKPINSSSSVPLERAAKAAIDKHNATSSVKIGDTFTSRKGITYKYVGGTRFISDNGKLLPKDTAQTVLNNLWQKADERKAQEQQDNQDEQPVQDTAQNDQQGSPAPQPESEPSQNDNASQGNEPLKGLADQIKSNPEARRIIVLLSRGDDLSLLAADILLSGQQKEVAQILNSLNNEE